jgi:hypothetical protein
VCPVHLTANTFFYKADRWAVSFRCAQYTLKKFLLLQRREVGRILQVCPIHLTANTFFYKEDRCAVSFRCAQYTLQQIPSFIKKTGGQNPPSVPSTPYSKYLLL